MRPYRSPSLSLPTLFPLTEPTQHYVDVTSAEQKPIFKLVHVASHEPAIRVVTAVLPVGNAAREGDGRYESESHRKHRERDDRDETTHATRSHDETS
jgi:hypothetical protein